MRKALVSLLTALLAGCAGDRPTNLGAVDGRLSPCPSTPNCVSSQATDEGQRIAPLSFSGDPAAAFARLKRILSRRPDMTIGESTGEYLRVEFRTRLGFVDDGEFFLDPGKGVIQVRSAARVGYSDLGKNRSRLEEIRSDYMQAEQGGGR